MPHGARGAALRQSHASRCCATASTTARPRAAVCARASATHSASSASTGRTHSRLATTGACSKNGCSCFSLQSSCCASSSSELSSRYRREHAHPQGDAVLRPGNAVRWRSEPGANRLPRARPSRPRNLGHHHRQRSAGRDPPRPVDPPRWLPSLLLAHARIAPLPTLLDAADPPGSRCDVAEDRRPGH